MLKWWPIKVNKMATLFINGLTTGWYKSYEG